MKKLPLAVAVLGSVTVLGGCATYDASTADAKKLERQLEQAQVAAANSEAETARLRAQLARSSGQGTAFPAGTSGDLLPPNAKPGHCYARVLLPAEYKSGSERVMARAASQRIEVIPATYEFVDQRVMVQEASTRLEIVPATYKKVSERIMIEPEKTVIREIPATYKTLSEKILVKPAYTTWKKGRGPVERLDESTGEIMCLVEVPAVYKTVAKKVVKTPARTVEETIPAKYKTVTRTVVSTPEKTRQVPHAARYETVKVRKLVKPATSRTIDIPAKYETVSTRKQVADSKLEWREILCETNTTPGLVSRLQQALNKEGYRAGKVDGVLGQQTMAAVKSYQRDKKMPSGQLTLGVLEKLNVML